MVYKSKFINMVQNPKTRKLSRLILLNFLLTIIAIPALAEQPKPESSMNNPFVVIMVVIILILALVIGLLANLVLGAAFVLQKKEKEESEKISSSPSKIVAMVIGLALLISPAYAQENNLAASNVINGISSATF